MSIGGKTNKHYHINIGNLGLITIAVFIIASINVILALQANETRQETREEIKNNQEIIINNQTILNQKLDHVLNILETGNVTGLPPIIGNFS